MMAEKKNPDYTNGAERLRRAYDIILRAAARAKETIEQGHGPQNAERPEEKEKDNFPGETKGERWQRL